MNVGSYACCLIASYLVRLPSDSPTDIVVLLFRHCLLPEATWQRLSAPVPHALQSDNNLPQTLLSDPNKEVRQLYQVDGDLFGILDGRQTFVIDENGIIKLVYNNQFGPDKHAEMALDVL